MGNYFIGRPVFAAVVAIVITLVGTISLRSTPVTQYPDIAPPTVTVSATYPGATAEVVAKTVATPLEEVVNGVEGMLYMSSTSTSSGSMSLAVTFEGGADANTAQVKVQNLVNQVVQTLPEPVRPSLSVSKQSGANLMLIAISSRDDRYDAMYLGNYANRYLLDPIKRVPGASSSSMFPLPDLAMRIWLKPEQMARLGVSTQDIVAAIGEQNRAYAVGAIGQSPAPPGTQQSFAVSTKGTLSEPAEFEEIILGAAVEGSTVARLKDVARVELGTKDNSVVSRVNGRKAAVIVVPQQAGANAIEVSREVRALLESLEPALPAGMECKVVLDLSTFTEASIEEVVKTFFIAVALVVLVVFLFLQSLRATLIPILAVPIAIVGSFVGIGSLGFTVNMLTLFGLILAIGLVVDDAIIVVEDVERNMAVLGMSPLEATRKAMKELSGALVAIVLVLGAVFLPVAFIKGMSGTLFRQFAVTIAISMVLSGVVALTLSPAMAPLILRPAHGEKRGFFRWFERSFGRLTERYVAGVRWLLTHRTVGVALFAGVCAASLALFRVIPASFVPDEDQGALIGASILPDAASLERTSKVSERILPLLGSNPAVADVLQIDGFGKSSNGMLVMLLKPFGQRKGAGADAAGVALDQRVKLAPLKEAIVVLGPPAAIPGLGGSDGFEFYIQDKGSAPPQELDRTTRAFLAEARKRRELADVRSDFSTAEQQLYVDVDRARAELLGVKVATVYETLQTYFASRDVSQFVRDNRICRVILQADGEYRDKPDDLTQVYVGSSRGGMIPLSVLATVSYVAGPGTLSHFNGFPAVKVNGRRAAGYSSGEAIAAMEEVARKVLPAGYAYTWSGQELEEKKSGSTSTIAFAMGLLMVFLILAALYEKWSLPLGVVLSVPFAVCGAELLTWGLGLENDIYFKVGLLTLVGLSAKNAILIIQVAARNLDEGMTAPEAAIEAARQRLRPIVMTSMAFVLGCVPMAVATGAGARSQRAIGTGVIGGMLASTLVASFFVPLFFVLLEEGSALLRRKTRGDGDGDGAGSRPEIVRGLPGLLLALVSASLLSGCTVGPDYARPVSPAPKGWNVDYEAAAGVADVAFWRQFGDPVLDGLVEEAVRSNLDLGEAAARVEQYMGTLQTTRSELFPQVDGKVNAGTLRADGGTTRTYGASLDVSWELDLWGRVRRATEADRAAILSSEAARRGTVLTVVSKVAEGYLRLRGLDRKLEIVKETESAYAKTLRLFRLRFEYGEISKVELSQQESLHEGARKEVPLQESLIRQQENALSVLLGRLPGPIPRGRALDALTPPAIPAGLPSELLERRPDIVGAEQDLISANARIGVAKAAYFPRLSLTGALGVASSDVKLFTSGAGTGSAAATLLGPVLDFGKTAGKVKEAEALKDQALYAYRRTILTGMQDVEDALVRTTKGRELLEAQERQVTALETYARLSRLQFEAGIADYLQVLDADRTLFSARLTSVGDRADLLAAVVSVYKAMGGGWVTEADRLRGAGGS